MNAHDTILKDPRNAPAAERERAISEAHARGVAEERARWLASCAQVFEASKFYTDPNMGMAARDTVRNVKAGNAGA